MAAAAAPPPLDEAARRHHKRRNLLQSLLLLFGLAGLLALCALLLLGPAASLWAAAGWGLAMLLAPRVQPAAVLALLGARPLSPAAFPEGHALLDSLAERAAVTPRPTLYYLPSSRPNAFTLGHEGAAAVAVTDGLLRLLDRRELAAVLAHEIGHLRNHDLWVMNLADSLSRLTRALGFVGLLLLLLGVPLLLGGEAGPSWLLGAALLALAPSVSALLQLALSRTREFDADLEAVALTGDPAGLASALAKLERGRDGLWRFLAGGRRGDAPSLLRSHPATAERLARLRRLVAETAADPGTAPPLDLSALPRHRGPPFRRPWG